MSVSSPSPQTRHYSLQVIRFEGATGVKTSKLYAKVRLGDDSSSWQTQKVKGSSPSWNETFTFSTPDTSSRFNIRVKYELTSLSRIFKKSNPSVGFVDISLEDLLRKCSHSSDGITYLILHPSLGRPGPSSGIGTLYLHLRRSDVISSVRTDIENAINSIRRRGIAGSVMGEKFYAIGDLTSQLGDQSDLYKSILILCSKIGIFADIINKLTMAHPYLNAAWQVTSSLFKAVEKKFEDDKSIVELVCTASDAFDFACEIEELPDKIQSLQHAITRLIEQTTKLCRFVQDYTSIGTPGQILTLCNNSQRIDDFKDSFSKIKGEFTAPLALQTAIVSTRMSEKIDTAYLKQELEPDSNIATSRPECLPGTRGEYLNTIMDWAFSDSEQNILWLHGVAGSGKSTISMTIAEKCSSTHRRGAYLFFEREKSDPNTVIRSIAFELASFHHSIAKNVSKAVEANKGIAKGKLARQFDVLLARPLQTASKDVTDPVVIILDAIDECGPPSARGDLLKLLAEKIPELPRNFRFLITSRKEGDIEAAFSNELTVVPVRLDHDSPESRGDVAAYFRHEMDALFITDEMKRSIRKDWPWDVNIRFLADTAGGLFIWASTAVKYLKVFGIIAFRKLDKLVTDIQSHGDAKFGLDDLYSTVLQSVQIPWNDEETRIRFSNILHLILDVGVVLSTDDIDGILGFPPYDSSTLIISQLQSVLAYTTGSTSRIRPLHASFGEFLKSPGQAQHPWHINIADCREYITKRCHESFDRMDRMLHFNICEIETSFICNNCIPDLQSRIEQKIVPELENACVYWIQQLRFLPYSLDLIPPLDRFLHSHLLAWLEVLSLTGKVDLAVSALVDVYKWVEGHSTSLESFLRDARKLVIAFKYPISKSMPHIYLSMLPLAWPGSEVATHFSRALTLQNTVEIVGSRSQRAPPTVFKGHTEAATSIAYSIDGKRIVSGSSDRTVIVWDSESGEVVAGPFRGHSDRVNSVGFSCDGKYVVSGSSDRTIIVWDSESGEILYGPFKGHVSRVNCVSFSPDGKHVVSGSSDSTIKVWVLASGKSVSITLEGHSDGVLTVAYSPNGMYVVSGAYDRTLRVWDVQSGIIVKVLEWHTDLACSVIFSPDGKRIVFGSTDNSISVWDYESGKIIGDPFEGHKGRVIFVAFSSDGKHILSGSWDSTMKVWDAESGEIISSVVGDEIYTVAFSPDGKRAASGSLNGTIQGFDMQADKDFLDSFYGHTGGIYCIAYSPDGKHVVSGSRDNTMIVWDMESGMVAAGPFKGHSSAINCVAYSPDGKRIVSGSYRKMLIVWDTKTGEVISGKFEGHTNGVLSVAFSPNGKRIVSGSYDKTIIFWDSESGTIILGPLKGHAGSVNSVGYSPDGKYIVSGSDDKSIRVWSTESGEVALVPFEGHKGKVRSVAYSPDGKYIVSGSYDRAVIVWDAESGFIIAGPFIEHIGLVYSVQFSPDSKRIVSGSYDNTIILWDVEIGKAVLGPLKGHKFSVMSVHFSPDGRHIASGSSDGTIRIWDMEAPSAEESTHKNWELSEHGWILGQEGELLLWIPSDMRASLCYPHNLAILNSQFVTKLHFTERGIGRNWHECFDIQKLTAD